MRITILGSGTSNGVPFINCKCDTCLSADKKDARLRASVLIEIDDTNILIDCGPDFRQQILRNPISHLNAVLLTHEHYDHVAGIDDLRAFRDTDIYAHNRACEQLKISLHYCFNYGDKPYPGVPKLNLKPISGNDVFEINGIKIIPIRYKHATLDILGYRIGNFAYLTDISSIEDSELEKLQNLEVLIVDALRIREHFSHFNLEQAQNFVQRVNPTKSYFTHISHDMGLHCEVQNALPQSQFLCYDGLKIEC